MVVYKEIGGPNDVRAGGSGLPMRPFIFALMVLAAFIVLASLVH